MENALLGYSPRRATKGVLRSFLQPADKLFAMVATQDVGRPGPLRFFRENGSGTQGRRTGGPPHGISPNDLARSLRRGAEAPRPGRDGAARGLGEDFPLSGNAKIHCLGFRMPRWASTRDGSTSASTAGRRLKGTTALEKRHRRNLVRASQAKNIRLTAARPL